MSDCSLYIENEVMDHWPFLPKLWRDAKFAGLPRGYMDSFSHALDARSQSSLALAWKGSADCLSGGWHPRTTPE